MQCKENEDKGEIPFSRHTSILATRANYSEAISSVLAKLEMAKNFHLPTQKSFGFEKLLPFEILMAKGYKMTTFAIGYFLSFQVLLR